MKSYEKPPGYAQIQESYNSIHTDGSLENDSDTTNAVENFSRISINEPVAILVLGCRTGYECEALRNYFEDPLVIGVDVVPVFVALSSKRVPTMLGDMHELDLPDYFFDLIVCRGTLEHCYNPKLALEEMYRVLDPTGQIYLTVDLEKDRKNFKSHFSFSEDPDEWITIMLEVGFRVINRGYDDGMCHKGLWINLEKNELI